MGKALWVPKTAGIRWVGQTEEREKVEKEISEREREGKSEVGEGSEEKSERERG